MAIDEGTSQKAGEGFSQFFGLNDSVTSTGLATYDTGLKASDPNGFTPGDQATLRLSSPNGTRCATSPSPCPGRQPDHGRPGQHLNSASSGVGLYGSFTLDAQGGLTFTGTAPQNAQVSVVSGTTRSAALAAHRSARCSAWGRWRSDSAGTYQVNPAMVADPTKIPTGTLDLSVAAGQSAITPGDGSGALALSEAGANPTLFAGRRRPGQRHHVAHRLRRPVRFLPDRP